MGILDIDLDKVSLDDDNYFYVDDTETIIHVRRGEINFKNARHLKNV